MPPKKKAEQPNLAAVLSEMRTKGKEPVGSLSDFQMIPKGLTTGNLILDALTGIGGLPAGRITELVGPPSSGKTTCLLQAMAHVQAQGGNVCFMDYERSLDETYVKALGVKTEDPSFIYMQPDDFEHGAKLFRALLATGELHMMGSDSVATMITRREIESETGDAEVMQRAKILHQFCRQIVGALHKTGCAAVFLNHQMQKVDLSPMGRQMAMKGIVQTTTPGGTALPFFSSVRAEFKQIKKIQTTELNELTNEKGKQYTATLTKATIIKNKVGEPFRTAELLVNYGRGFSQAHAVLSTLVAHGVVSVTPSTGKYKYPEGLQGPNSLPNGEFNQYEALEKHPEWLKLLEGKALEVLADKGFEKVDSSLYDKDGNEIVEGQVILSLEDSEEEMPDWLPEKGGKVNMSTGEIK